MQTMKDKKLKYNGNYSASPTAEAWGVWCGGEAATPHPPNLTHAE